MPNMEELKSVTRHPIAVNEVNSFNEIGKMVSSNSSSPNAYNLKPSHTLDDSSDEEAPILKSRKRIQQFTDSDSESDRNKVSTGLDDVQIMKPVSRRDSEDENILKMKRKTVLSDEDSNSDSNNKETSKKDSENEATIPNSKFKKSSIHLHTYDSDSDGKEDLRSSKNEEQQIRMKNKHSKLKDRFKSLLSSREKHVPHDDIVDNTVTKSSDESQGSDQSGNELSSVKKIKQIIREGIKMVPSICDPDTSDESDSHHKEVPKYRQKKERRSTKPTSPKPIRMSAKQAMENMHKIKSESNRRLREKEVSLPYHRPKALSLKDIMNRRKPAVTADGKAFPIKMNEEQLKQYAQMLEQRQKEMMELCKSESDEDFEEPTLEEPPTNTDSLPNVEIKINNTIVTENEGNAEGMQIDLSKDKTIEDEHDKRLSINTHDGDTASTNRENAVPETEEQDKEIIDDNQKDSIITEMKLLYDDSVEKSSENIELGVENTSLENNRMVEDSTENEKDIDNAEQKEEISTEPLSVNDSKHAKVFTEPESQLINLHYDSEITDINTEPPVLESNDTHDKNVQTMDVSDEMNKDFMSDDEFNMDDIDKMIENAEIIKENGNGTISSKEMTLNMKPRLTGAPGMVIDLNESDPASKRLSGVELLKERFTYFAKLKTPEEMERAREKKLKPGAQHLKLKQDLEDQIAEQRSLEWAKRLEDVKQQQKEMDTMRGDTSDVEDDIEKIEAKLEEKDSKIEENSEREEELVEDDIEIKDKPRKHNPMLDEEAEESECDDIENDAGDTELNQDDMEENPEQDNENEEESEDSSEDESSASEEEEETMKTKKGRILKAFEDSDDEQTGETVKKDTVTVAVCADDNVDNSIHSHSQDEDIQLAQRHKSVSDDLFSSQEIPATSRNIKDNINDIELGTQTFSILDSEPPNTEFKNPDEVGLLCGEEPYHDPKVAALACGLTQRVLSSQMTETQLSPSQPIGEDILALCTGQFYDNQFVSQTDERSDEWDSQNSIPDYGTLTGNEVEESSISDSLNKVNDSVITEYTAKHSKSLDNHVHNVKNSETKEPIENSTKATEDGNLLKSILDELNDPEFDDLKPNKYFTGPTQKKENDQNIDNTQTRKKFIIDSDDETDKTVVPTKKKIKKKKLEKRALHISDDEEEDYQDEAQDDHDQYVSDVEEDNDERVVDYDSEENEIEVKPQNPKKKRKATDYFEQEAELTSEDEWVGSGDEDEAGLDRMEREEGDDDVFHQGQLRKELGQIHMRDVLDQDKREVRLLQELLFEDGDLGDGHRQRKFRWRNADGDEETGTMVDEFGDTQEDEFESEEQWRKQRHEREVFLRQMKMQDEDLNISVNSTAIINTNLSSNAASLVDANQSKNDSPVPAPVKTAKDIPSPKKSFAIFQQNYHGSLLTRGRGALARLAALATPLAADDDAPKIGSLAPSSKRNFVFAALTPDDKKPKVTIKRKADTNLGTPKLVKKMKTEEKQKSSKNSLLDHLKVL